MRFILRFLLLIGFVIVGAWIAAMYIPSFKQSVVEIVNPAAKEKRLLTDLSTQMDIIEKTISESDQGGKTNQTKQTAGEVAGVQQAIDKSQDIIREIEKINETKFSTVTATSGRIMEMAKRAARIQQSFSFQDESGTQFLCSPQ